MKLAYLPYNKKLLEVARDLRRHQTPAEQRLWQYVLRYRKLRNYKFLRQKLINNFIVDFYCPRLLLIIEVDGDSHDFQKTYDADRTNKLKEFGLKVIRFSNNQIMNEIEGVYKEIVEVTQVRAKQLKSHNLP